MPEEPREIDASIDVSEVARFLASRYGEAALVDYLVGKTEMRDAVRDEFGCSALEAEEIVDLLEFEGYLEFLADELATEPGQGVWRVSALADG